MKDLLPRERGTINLRGNKPPEMKEWQEKGADCEPKSVVL